MTMYGGDRLAGKSLKLFRKGFCPCCKQNTLRPGPQGGLAQNVICSACGSRYNNTPFGVDILDENEGARKRPARISWWMLAIALIGGVGTFWACWLGIDELTKIVVRIIGGG